MGKMSLTCISIMLFVIIIFWMLGLIHIVIFGFSIGSSSYNYNLSNMDQGNFGSTHSFFNFIQDLFAFIAILGIAMFGAVVVYGVVNRQPLDSVLWMPVAILMFAILSAVLSVAEVIWNINHLLAIFTIGMFMLLSLLVIIDWWAGARLA